MQRRRHTPIIKVGGDCVIQDSGERNEDEAMELLESDYGILNDDERVDLKWLNVEETE